MLTRSIVPPFCCALLVLAGCASMRHAPAEREDLRRHFVDAGFPDGTCIVLDVTAGRLVTVNGDRAGRELLPASTFKIVNSLVALETGVVADEHTVFEWDGVERERSETNRDFALAGAFRDSVLWYYEEIARRVGRERYEYWLARVGYGNCKASGPNTAFWLDGDLRISARQQVRFLDRLRRGDLPFSRRSMEIVRRIMVLEETPEYTLRGKTGWARPPGEEIGWWVGWVERRDGRAFVFATNLVAPRGARDFGAARLAITRAILADLQALPPGHR
jgi:beta-lactamase class D